MKNIEILLQSLHEIPKTYFSLRDIEKFYRGNPESLPVIISRLAKRGILQRVWRTYYSFDRTALDFESFACTIQKNSYISLESALYHYGLLEQIPQTLTLVTTGKSHHVDSYGKFIEYSHIQASLFFGYEITGNILMAVKEKAILDMLYYISLKKRRLSFNPAWFSTINKKLFAQWLDKYPFYTRICYKVFSD